MNKTLIIQVVVITSIVAGYFLIDFNKVYTYFKPNVDFKVQATTCDLHKTACEVKLNEQNKFTLEVFPKSIPLMEELKFVLKTNKELEENSSLNIYATNMFMGYFNLNFKKSKEGVYIAKGTLPTCPVGNMKWNADIELGGMINPQGVRFKFQTTR
ncbi:MAG: hypothetical protein ACQERD_05890 [Campylobacterota bacterium]